MTLKAIASAPAKKMYGIWICLSLNIVLEVGVIIPATFAKTPLIANPVTLILVGQNSAVYTSTMVKVAPMNNFDKENQKNKPIFDLGNATKD